MLSLKKKIGKWKADISMPVLLVCSVAVFSSLAVTHGDTTLATGFLQHRVLPITRYLLALLIIIYTSWKSPSQNIGLKLVWMLVWFFFSYLYLSEQATFSFGLIAICNILFLLSVFFCREDNLVKAIKLYRYYLITISVLGIIAYIDFVTGGHLPHEMVDYYADYEDTFYIDYRLAYLALKGTGIRLCGLFNEPGYFGTFIALFLIMDGLRLNKVGNIIILVAGMLTFSMAFFVLLMIGAVYYFIKNKTYYVIIPVLILLLAVPVLRNVDIENESVNLFLERIDYMTENKESILERRKDDNFRSIERRFDEENHHLFGYGSGYCKTHGVYDTSSYKSNVIEWGYLGFFLVYAGLILLAAFETKLNGKVLLFLLCFSISITQRPSIFIPAYFLLLFGGIYYIKDNEVGE